MFITKEEKNGTEYFEFQFCKIKRPLNFKNKIRYNVIKFWKEDSLLLSIEDFDTFINIYGNYFLINGEKGFNYFGPNYYDKVHTKMIFDRLKKNIDKKYEKLIPWLEEAIIKYNGFYILGI